MIELLRGFGELRSLRYRALGVVVLVVVLPLLWVWAVGPLEQNIVLNLRKRLRDALSEATLDGLASSNRLSEIARTHRIRLRVIGPDGAVLEDFDEVVNQDGLQAVADPFFGPGGAPTLSEFDADQPPVGERKLVREATATPTASCRVVEKGLLLACSATQRLSDGSRVHVMRGSPRLVRSLYEERFQLTAVTLTVLGIGVIVAGWLSWRMVGPIEQLRDQVMARTEGTVSTEPIQVGQDDEFGQLARAFNALLGALDDRNRANAEFAADLAHELKNPVAAVRAAAEALGPGSQVDEERRQRLFRVLDASAGRLEEVIGQFLDLARAEAGLPDTERELVDLRALAEGVISVYRADERHNGLTFTVQGPSETVWAAAERLETAVHNLVSNAAEFAARFERKQGPAVGITIEATAAQAILRVSDTGPGIPLADRERVFDRYVTTRENGTGLGLALTKAIVHAHGGTIELEGPPEGGTTMVVRLPRGSQATS
ncbi:MAG: HAMP domain-containing sensor histidine kinase [Myxococcota bacterium]